MTLSTSLRAKRSNPGSSTVFSGLLRRVAPRNDEDIVSELGFSTSLRAKRSNPGPHTMAGLLRRVACARTARSADPGAPRNDFERPGTAERDLRKSKAPSFRGARVSERTRKLEVGVTCKCGIPGSRSARPGMTPRASNSGNETYPPHCERSEAIQSHQEPWIASSAAPPRNDGREAAMPTTGIIHAL